jgi:hypothetical protein
MLPVSTPGTRASLTFQVSPLVFVTVVQAYAVDVDAATIAATATASRAAERDARKASS